MVGTITVSAPDVSAYSLVADGGYYYLNNRGRSNPTLEAVQGQTLEVTWPNSHPFWVSESPGHGATPSSLATVGNGVTTITVPLDFEGPLYYYCELHPSMVGNITIAAPEVNQNETSGCTVCDGGMPSPETAQDEYGLAHASVNMSVHAHEYWLQSAENGSAEVRVTLTPRHDFCEAYGMEYLSLATVRAVQVPELHGSGGSVVYESKFRPPCCVEQPVTHFDALISVHDQVFLDRSPLKTRRYDLQQRFWRIGTNGGFTILARVKSTGRAHGSYEALFQFMAPNGVAIKVQRLELSARLYWYMSSSESDTCGSMNPHGAFSSGDDHFFNLVFRYNQSSHTVTFKIDDNYDINPTICQGGSSIEHINFVDQIFTNHYIGGAENLYDKHFEAHCRAVCL